MAGLTIRELRKRNNFEVFLKKIKLGMPFDLVPRKQKQFGIKTITIFKEERLLSGLEKLSQDPTLNPESEMPELCTNKGLLLVSSDPNGIKRKIKSGLLQKTWDFGSKTSEMIYVKEEQEHKTLKRFLIKLTNFETKPITLIIKTSLGNEFIYKNVLKIKSISRNTNRAPKADFEFLDKDDNVLVSISHKDGKVARNFRQWSGLKDFLTHPEILNFETDLKKHLGTQETFPATLTIGRPIVDKRLKELSVFGTEGNTVDFLMQGKCSFVPTAEQGTYLLEAGLILQRTEGLDKLPPEYDPIIIARRGDTTRNSFGIKLCRGLIYPVGGRKIHLFLNETTPRSTT